jgi:hypothetical protein
LGDEGLDDEDAAAVCRRGRWPHARRRWYGSCRRKQSSTGALKACANAKSVLSLEVNGACAAGSALVTLGAKGASGLAGKVGKAGAAEPGVLRESRDQMGEMVPELARLAAVTSTPRLAPRR